jgi:hypothetical protein
LDLKCKTDIITGGPSGWGDCTDLERGDKTGGAEEECVGGVLWHVA